MENYDNSSTSSSSRSINSTDDFDFIESNLREIIQDDNNQSEVNITKSDNGKGVKKSKKQSASRNVRKRDSSDGTDVDIQPPAAKRVKLVLQGEYKLPLSLECNHPSSSSATHCEQCQIDARKNYLLKLFEPCLHKNVKRDSCDRCFEREMLFNLLPSGHVTLPNVRIPLQSQQGRGSPTPGTSNEVKDQDSGFSYDKFPETTGGFVLDVKNTKSFRGKNVATEVTYHARLMNGEQNDKLLIHMEQNILHLFESLLDHILRTHEAHDMARIYIQHPKLAHAIIIPPTYLGYLSPQMIWDHINYVLHSATDIPADDGLDINVAIVRNIQGKNRLYMTNLAIDTVRKRSIITIKNTDNLCLARAIVVACAHLESKENKSEINSKYFKKIRNPKNKEQGQRALELMNRCDIPITRAGLLADVPAYEADRKVSICVISAVGGNQRVYNGCADYTKRIFIFHYNTSITDDNEERNGHYDVITSVSGLMCRKYYCDSCHKGYDMRDKHSCPVYCNICERKGCIKKDNLYKCDNCNKMCRSEDCFKAHKQDRIAKTGPNKGGTIASPCERSWKCPDCGTFVNRQKRNEESHKCGESKCNICLQYYMDEEGHLCYMRSISVKDKQIDKFLFYDFECQQHTGVHVPNFVVAQTVCSLCKSESVTPESKCVNCGDRCKKCSKYNKAEKEYECEPCPSTCGYREKIFSGDNTCKDFCSWLISELHKNVTAIAHNARAYDAYFVYSHCVKNSIVPQPVIFNGSKIVYMNVGRGLNIRLLDSLNFLPMGLAKLPKSFDLSELKKGYFPHYFNTPENQNAILQNLPDIKYYDPDSMTADKRAAFLKWYDEHKQDPFNFKEEMEQYCRSDVDILLKACMKYRDLIQSITGVEESTVNDETLETVTQMTTAIDPFCFLTLASVCMGLFRAKFLPETWSVLLEADADKDCPHDMDCDCDWTEAKKENGDADLQVLSNGNWADEKEFIIVEKKFVSSPVGLIPPHGYGRKDNHSVQSLHWLRVLEWELQQQGHNVSIQDARGNDGEKVVAYSDNMGRRILYKLDGFYVDSEGYSVACEFNGCHWHGCLVCYPLNRETTMVYGKSIAQRFRDTLLKRKRLEELGYKVKTKWSCQFDRDIIRKSFVRNVISSLHYSSPINMRDCYTGGRVGTIKMYKQFTKDEKCDYVDFCSLYPSVLKQNRYPIGHPTRIITNFASSVLIECKYYKERKQCDYNFSATEPHCHWEFPYFGVAKVTILPPQDLLYPIIPLRCNGKLKFPLCCKCAHKTTKNKCKCSPQERSFTVTVCTPELEVAINMGYEILEIHEVLHWKESSIYDPKLGTGGLFAAYVNTFLQLKQQANGLPLEINSEKEIDDYIQRYYQHEHILLNKDKLEKNEGLRQCAKLKLNTLYGKFGQHTNMVKTKFVSDVGPLYNIMTDSSKKLVDYHVMSDSMMQINFEHQKLFQPMDLKTNVVVAAFCTTHARLKLWFVMNALQNRVLYHDTDSIVYSYKRGEYCPPVGEYLGQLTNELSCSKLQCNKMNCDRDHWITEFVSCGPKNYAFKLNTGEYTCKVRGFSLNHKGSQILNFESMKTALFNWYEREILEIENEKLDEEPAQLVTLTTIICRDKYKAIVYNRKVNKHYDITFDKRLVIDNYDTVPYGYNNDE